VLDDQAWFALYRLLAALGFPRPEVNAEALPRVAWPETRTAIAVPGDPDPGKEWQVVTLTVAEIESTASLLGKLQLLSLDHQLRASRGEAKRRTSTTEQAMLAELLKAGLPEPDRNLAVRDPGGTIRAIPDFAWSDVGGAPVKVALEVDGWHWHVGIDLANEIAAAAAGDPEVAKKLRRSLQEKGAKDAAKRRLLQQQGWVVLVVHDTELADGAGAAVAQEIRQTIDRRRHELLGADTQR
jgi:G:T-mismatch repair DNA endonuclease (very short patch repair protein)